MPVESFLVPSIPSNFGSRPGHFDYYVMRLWVKCTESTGAFVAVDNQPKEAQAASSRPPSLAFGSGRFQGLGCGVWICPSHLLPSDWAGTCVVDLLTQSPLVLYAQVSMRVSHVQLGASPGFHVTRSLPTLLSSLVPFVRTSQCPGRPFRPPRNLGL